MSVIYKLRPSLHSTCKLMYFLIHFDVSESVDSIQRIYARLWERLKLHSHSVPFRWFLSYFLRTKIMRLLLQPAASAAAISHTKNEFICLYIYQHCSQVFYTVQCVHSIHIHYFVRVLWKCSSFSCCHLLIWNNQKNKISKQKKKKKKELCRRQWKWTKFVYCVV